ncbi:MAG: 1-(5-phosphoribosyl)-5-[(5-phosphoribosylamino)methylideneamino]imidazole-4-carboxamide isomerase [Rudaea sp.]
MSFVVYPAIDVRGGRVVRLRQGDYAQETRYGDDPLAVAQRYADAGARWLHLVDLEAARQGGCTLAPLLRATAKDGRLSVQIGGGVRSADDVHALIDAGAQRVVVGSLAVREPERILDWLDCFGSERITIALDARCDADGIWRLPVRGWTESSGVGLLALLDRYVAAARHLLCTDIARDGMLGGPNVDLYKTLCARYPKLAVQASGGIRDVRDLSALRAIGCAGAITGKALLDGAMTIDQALAC